MKGEVKDGTVFLLPNGRRKTDATGSQVRHEPRHAGLLGSKKPRQVGRDCA